MDRVTRRQRSAIPRLDDEAAADVARDQLRAQGVIPLEPGPSIAVMLAPGEHLLTVRHMAHVELLIGSDEPPTRDGALYLTDRRLVLVEPTLDLPLGDIRDVEVVDGGLMLLLDGSGGVRIHIDDPRVFRVEISAARSAHRVACGARPDGQSDSR
jgi:hypothetical protein